MEAFRHEPALLLVPHGEPSTTSSCRSSKLWLRCAVTANAPGAAPDCMPSKRSTMLLTWPSCVGPPDSLVLLLLLLPAALPAASLASCAGAALMSSLPAHASDIAAAGAHARHAPAGLQALTDAPSKPLALAETASRTGLAAPASFADKTADRVAAAWAAAASFRGGGAPSWDAEPLVAAASFAVAACCHSSGRPTTLAGSRLLLTGRRWQRPQHETSRPRRLASVLSALVMVPVRHKDRAPGAQNTGHV